MIPAPAAPLAAMAFALSTVSANAQDAAPVAQAPAEQPGATAPEDRANDPGNEIVVIGSRMAGQVETAKPPIKELDEDDVASYGAGSLEELLGFLAPETGSGRGRGGDIR